MLYIYQCQYNSIVKKYYDFRVEYYVPDHEYVGTCNQFPSLSHLDATPEKALQGIKELVASIVLHGI